jgi:alpha-L-arabinofuranosidase
MMAVNLGTRGVQDACDLLEYANLPGGSRWADLRRAHGDADPYGIRLWCLGNEMDGPWQVGHKTAHEYGRLAAETARAMRLVDPAIELVACGSSGRDMPTFGEWERTVLEECYDLVDHVSAHAYYEEHDRPGGAADFLACATDMDAFVEEVVATVDAVRARGRHAKRVTVCFDEWNVWYLSRHMASDVAQQRTDWQVAPRVAEDAYTVTDAVVVGTLLHSLLRHADRVAIACQAQLVNALGMLHSEPGGPAWKQTTALPFERVRHHAVGEVLQVRTGGDRHESTAYGDVPVVDTTATWDEDAGVLSLFLANRDLDRSTVVTASLHGFPPLRPLDAVVLAPPDGDRQATNTADAPGRVRLRALDGVEVGATERGTAVATVPLPPLSWAHVRLTTRPA